MVGTTRRMRTAAAHFHHPSQGLPPGYRRRACRPPARGTGVEGEQERCSDAEREPLLVRRHRTPPEAGKHKGTGDPDEQERRDVTEPAQGAGAQGTIALEGQGVVVGDPRMEVLAEGAGLHLRGRVADGIPQFQKMDVEVDVESRRERRGEDEEGEGWDGDPDDRQVGLARGCEEIRVLDGEKCDADVGQKSEEAEPGGAGDRGQLIDAGDLLIFAVGHAGADDLKVHLVCFADEVPRCLPPLYPGQHRRARQLCQRRSNSRPAGRIKGRPRRWLGRPRARSRR